MDDSAPDESPDPDAVAAWQRLNARLSAPPVELTPIEVVAPDDLLVIPADETSDELPRVAVSALDPTPDEREQYEVEFNEIKFRLMDGGLPERDAEASALAELESLETWTKRRRGEPTLIEYERGKFM